MSRKVKGLFQVHIAHYLKMKSELKVPVFQLKMT